MITTITLFKRINWTAANISTISLAQAVEIIRTGEYQIIDDGNSYTLKHVTQLIQNGSYQPNVLQEIKMRYLPAVSFNGTFQNGLITHYSSITAIDFDHIPNQEVFNDICMRLVKTSCVVNIFKTPSGRGLKAVVLHDNTDPAKHGDMYCQLLEMFKYTAVNADSSCKDLFRRNYLCWDPYVYTNPNPVPFHYVPSIKPSIACNLHSMSQSGMRKTGAISSMSILNIMNKTWNNKHPEYWIEGNRATSIFKLSCQLCRWGVDKALAIEYFINGWSSPTISCAEITNTVENAYKNEHENFGTTEFKVYK